MKPDTRGVHLDSESFVSRTVPWAPTATQCRALPQLTAFRSTPAFERPRRQLTPPSRLATIVPPQARRHAA